MTKEKTISNNILIAEFMGFKSNKAEYYKIPNKMWHTHNSSDSYVMHHSSNLLFDKEWDWLMPVVEEIEKRGYISTIEKMQLPYTEHRVWFNESNTMKEFACGARDESKFIATYNAVVDFIEFYNKLKNKKGDSEKQYIYIIASYKEDNEFHGYLGAFSASGLTQWIPSSENAIHFDTEEACIFKDGQSWEDGRDGGKGVYKVLALQKFSNGNVAEID